MPICIDGWKDQDMLMRTAHNGQVRRQTLTMGTTRLKAMMPDAERVDDLSYSIVYRSGMFDRAYKYDLETRLPYYNKNHPLVPGAIDVYRKIFENPFETQAVFFKLLSKYKQYKRARRAIDNTR